MTPTRSLFRVAAVTGAAAFLFSLAHVSPAAAQTSTRHTASCQATSYEGAGLNATCNINVPAGKVFIVESAVFGGYTWGRLSVKLATKKGTETFWHYIPPGSFQPVELNSAHWTGALPGQIFSEGDLTMQISKQSSTFLAWIRVTLSGRLEDM